MIARKTSQGVEYSALLGGRLVHMHYIGYTRREALALFRRYLRDLREGK